MNTADATQAMPAPSWSDPRIHLLDDTWLLTIFAILLATVAPWLVSGFDIDFLASALGLLLLGAIHIAFTAIGKPARAGERRPLLAGLHVAGVLVVGFIWLHAGGLQNPAFLLVFAIPVVGAIFLSRWQPYLMALLAVVVVGAIALAQAPELRWYAPGLNAVGAALATVLGQKGATLSTPFPGFYAPSGYSVVLLEVFAIMACACAVAAEYLGAVFERLHEQVDVARAEAEHAQAFWTDLIEGLPAPALLVDAESLQLVCASERAGEFLAAAPAIGQSVFESVRFSYPDVIQTLITGAGGMSPFSMVRVGDRLRPTAVHVQHLTQKGRRFAFLVINDQSEEFTVKAALDVTEQAVLAIDPQGRVIAFNTPARTLFAGIEKDADAATLLSLAGMPARWWEPGITGRRKMHVEIAPRIYQVASSALPLPGEEEQLYVVTLMPVSRSAANERTGTVTIAQLADTATATAIHPPLVSSK